MCKKLNLLHAKMGEWEYSAEPKIPKLPKSKKNEGAIEGLVHDPAAAMPSDSEMLMYSSPYFDVLQSDRKQTKARNEV